MLTSVDSNLTIMAFPGEYPIISGGNVISGLNWFEYGPGPTGGMNAPLSGK